MPLSPQTLRSQCSSLSLLEGLLLLCGCPSRSARATAAPVISRQSSPSGSMQSLQCWYQSAKPAMLVSKVSLSKSDTFSFASSIVHKKLQHLTHKIFEAIASLRNSLNSSGTVNVEYSKADAPRSLVWAVVLRNLTHLYPDSQLPETIVCNILKHYDSLRLRLSLVIVL